MQVKNGDLTTVQTEGNLGWPRVLLNGSEDADGDGRGGVHMECTDPFGEFHCQHTYATLSLVSFA
jgi:hypothetical protein